MSYVCIVNEADHTARIYKLDGAEDDEARRWNVVMHIRREHPTMLVTVAEETITLEQYQAMCEPGTRH